MEKSLKFETRKEFRNWLEEHCRTSEGIWVLFGKTTKLKTIKASEALEEALCYGWIDGVMKKVDENSYIKYFSERRKNSNWSDKNKGIIKMLEEKGMMTNFGRQKIEEAKKNGQWEKINHNTITEEEIKILEKLLRKYDIAYENFKNMSSSIRKTYTRAYLNAKTDDGKENRLAWIVDRLERNLKPM